MAVTAQLFTFCNSHSGRSAGNYVRFLCDTEAELPSTDVIDGDFAITLDTGKPWTRSGGVWVLNTAIDVVAVRLMETSGPTSLLIGSVSDGQFLKRSGSNVVGASGTSSEAFPVGSVFISVVSTNPNTLLGYGTWSAIGSGRVLVGLNAGDPDFDTLEETGGAKTVTLSVAQMPSHTHVQDAHSHAQRRNNVTTGANSGWTTAFDTSSSSPVADVNTGTGSTTATNQSTGGDGSHPNVQPYLVCMFWKRTA